MLIAYRNLLLAPAAEDEGRSTDRPRLTEAIYRRILERASFPLEAFEQIFSFYPNFPRDGYEKLFAALFGLDPKMDGESFLKAAIDRIILGSNEPCTLLQFMEVLHTHTFGKAVNGYWSRLLFATDRLWLDNSLLTLTPREARVIALRFGLNQKEHTLQETAEVLNPGDPLSTNRISQIEAKALRKLRHPSRTAGFSQLISSGLDVRCAVLADQVVQLTQRLEQLDPKSTEAPAPIVPQASGPMGADAFPILIDELELSVRAYNGLRNAEVKTIRDLVVKTEAELLKYAHFGRKTLNEVKDILAGYGLTLEMQIEDSAL